MITKFVVRKSYENSSIKIRYFDSLEVAIGYAKAFYKENWLDRELNRYEIIVEESRFANDKKLAQDFAIDRHVRWASYFNEV